MKRKLQEPLGYKEARLRDDCLAAWNSDPELEEEFRRDFDAYLAYCRAEASGRVKIHGKNASVVRPIQGEPERFPARQTDVSAVAATPQQGAEALKILQEWKADAALRGRFGGSLAAYITHVETAAARPKLISRLGGEPLHKSEG